jgi:serine/threonine protein kinase/tetratricopeptide (TPR) repeat protein
MTDFIHASPLPSRTARSSQRVLDEDSDLEGQMILQSVHAKLFGEELEPTVVGVYKIVKRLGSGGMGEVYLALNTDLERYEALKVVRSARAREPRDRQRLVEEAKSLARLSHPNVVHVYGGEVEAGNFYLAMEFAPGQTMEAWQKAGPHPWRSLLEVYIAAGQGLWAVHQVGMVHRDFKPSNVILGEREGDTQRVRVIDFGLAVLDGVGREVIAGVAASGTTPYGTPYFLSPEQCRGEAVTARSDQFSFCTALYDALYHQHPYYVPDPTPASPSRIPTDSGTQQPPTTPRALTALLDAICDKDRALRQPPADTGVPRAVFKLLARGLERDPARRYASMEELLKLLARQLRPSMLPWLIGIGVGGLIAGGAIYAAVAQGMPGSCKNVGSAVAGVWNDARSDELRRHFLRTERPYADATHAAVKRTVDAYVKEWETVHGAACTETYVEGTLDAVSYLRRKRCLDANLTTLETTLQAFEAADGQTVDRAYTTIAALRPNSDCSLLSAEVCVTDALLDEVPEVRDTFLAIQALEGAGRYTEAADKAAEAVTQATARDSPALVAEAEYRRGRLLAETASWGEAQTALERAIRGAEANNCRPLAVDAMNELGRVDGLDTRTAQSNIDFWEVVSGVLEGMEEGGLRLARAHKNRGLSFQRKQSITAEGEDRDALLQRAEAEFLRAQAIQREVRPLPHDELSTADRNLGLVALDLGKTKLALDHLASAREQAIRAYGEGHPATWRSEFDYGHALVEDRQGPAAVKHLEAALTLANAAYDRDGNNLGRVHVELARAHELVYDYLKVKDHAKAAEELFDRMKLQPENKHRFAGRRMLAQAYEMLGEYDEALALRVPLVADAWKVAEDPRDEVVISFLHLAETRLSLQQWDQARAAVETGLALLTPKEDELREELEGLAARAWLGQRDPRATAALKVAEESARKFTEEDPNDVISRDIWLHLAWALAQATCTEVPPDVLAALETLRSTPRLDQLKQSIQSYKPAQCSPLAPQPKP